MVRTVGYAEVSRFCTEEHANGDRRIMGCYSYSGDFDRLVVSVPVLYVYSIWLHYLNKAAA